MRIFQSLAVLASTTIVSAQTSPGAPYDIGNYLPVSFNNSVTVQPGALFQPNQLLVGPTFGVAQTNTSANQPFIVILIDINVVLNQSNPSNQTEFLHVLQPNLYAANSTNGNLTFNANGPNSSTVVGQAYYPPTPPPGSVHHYNVMLFKQPANFTIPPMFSQYNQPADLIGRARFNMTVFAAQSGLGQPLAANYYRALNGTVAQSSSVQSQTATSGVPFPSGYSFTTSTGSVGSGTTASGSSSATRSATSSAATPSTSISSASDSNDLGQSFVKGVCVAMAAALPWIW